MLLTYARPLLLSKISWSINWYHAGFCDPLFPHSPKSHSNKTRRNFKFSLFYLPSLQVAVTQSPPLWSAHTQHVELPSRQPCSVVCGVLDDAMSVHKVFGYVGLPLQVCVSWGDTRLVKVQVGLSRHLGEPPGFGAWPHNPRKGSGHGGLWGVDSTLTPFNCSGSSRACYSGYNLLLLCIDWDSRDGL